MFPGDATGIISKLCESQNAAMHGRASESNPDFNVTAEACYRSSLNCPPSTS